MASGFSCITMNNNDKREKAYENTNFFGINVSLNPNIFCM
jgi:hypothetical protein